MRADISVLISGPLIGRPCSCAWITRLQRTLTNLRLNNNAHQVMSTPLSDLLDELGPVSNGEHHSDSCPSRTQGQVGDHYVNKLQEIRDQATITFVELDD